MDVVIVVVMSKRGAPTVGLRGRRQKAAALSAEAPVDTVVSRDCSLISYLLDEWWIGRISAPQIQRITMKAWGDQKQLLRRLKISEDHADEELHKLARMGTYGTHSNHCHDDLMNYLIS